MPARPLSDETLQLIAAVRDALEHRADVEERTMFGWYVFFVDGKMCLGVRGEELLVRLPPTDHDRMAERPGVRALDSRGGMQGYFCVEPSAFATSTQWQEWVDAALLYNPHAKASPKRKVNGNATAEKKKPTAKKPTAAKQGRKRHSIFESDL